MIVIHWPPRTSCTVQACVLTVVFEGLFAFESVSDVEGCATNPAESWETNPHLNLEREEENEPFQTNHSRTFCVV